MWAGSSSLNVPVLIVDGRMASLKLAVTELLTLVSVEPSAGANVVTVGGVVSGCIRVAMSFATSVADSARS